MSDSDREILDLIDRGSLDEAQLLIRKKIQKFPKRSLYYALNNQVLHRQGQTNQAMTNNLNLLAKCPNDPQTVQVLSEFFAETGRPTESSLVYENVARKYPTSESTRELLLDWFNKTVAGADVKLSNKISTLLGKSTSDNRRYKLWNVFFNLQLSVDSDQGSKESKLYKMLALRILQDLKPLVTTHEVFLLCKLLQMNEDYETIAHEVSQLAVVDLELQLIHLDALTRLERWEDLKSYTYKLIFEQKFNDFDSWKLFIKANHKLKVPFDELSLIISQADASRNSKLAKVEQSFVYEHEYDSALKEYYSSMSTKLCCFMDLKYYLTERSSSLFIEHLGASKHDNLMRSINHQKLIYFTSDKTPEFTDEFIKSNWVLYHQYKSNGTGEFDNDPLNELALQAIVLDLSRDQSVECILKNIVILSHLLQSDKYNHNLRLWLIKLYANLNAGNQSMYQYHLLKIKMVQHETLSHLLIPLNPSKQHLSDLVNIYRFYLTAEDEIRATISEGFSEQVYNKLHSFVKFGTRLNNSVSKYFIVSKIIQASIILNDLGYVNYFIGVIDKKSQWAIGEDFNIIDNRDLKTEWKSLPIEPFTKLDTHLKVVSPVSIRINILKYLLIFEDDLTKADTYYKFLNVFVSSPESEQIHQFDLEILKFYINITKLLKLKGTQIELKSANNFLVTNLSFGKLKKNLVSQTWSSSYNMCALMEFIKVAQLLFSRNSSAQRIYKELYNCIVQLSKESKKCPQSVLTDLKKIKLDIKEISLTSEELGSLFADISDSTAESALYLSGM